MFDPTKPVQTRDGRKARVLCTDLQGECPMGVAVLETDGEEVLYSYYLDGQFIGDQTNKEDLVNVPEKRSLWVNIYPNDVVGGAYKTRAMADRVKSPDRLACLEFTYEVPQQ